MSARKGRRRATARRPGPVRLPPSRPGQRIGLYGGSFDPPHAGHRHVALLALRRLGLDAVWWIVTPGNPLKDHTRLRAEAAREAEAARLARHPRMRVTGFEAAIGATYTVETIRFLKRRCPGVRFVWIMGADSLASFHRWRHWRDIMHLLPVAVIDRPGWTLGAARSRAADAFAGARLREAAAPALADRRPPAWTFIHGPRSPLSSTMLRNRSAHDLDRR